MTNKIKAIAINGESIDYFEVVDNNWQLIEHLATVKKYNLLESKAGKFRKKYGKSTTAIVKGLQAGTPFDPTNPKVSAGKARKKARQRLIRDIHLISIDGWNSYKANYPSPAIALAKAIQTLNRWIKRDDVDKWDRETAYHLKDEWIRGHKQYLIKAEISSLKSIFYREEFKYAMDFKTEDEWIDKEDFYGQKVLYAYEFLVEGETIKFHSFSPILEEKPPINHKSLGSSKALVDDEIPKIRLRNFMRLIGAGLGLDSKSGVFYPGDKD